MPSNSITPKASVGSHRVFFATDHRSSLLIDKK
jgi:hypothetical protein